jgi:hypothetical protein
MSIAITKLLFSQSEESMNLTLYYEGLHLQEFCFNFVMEMQFFYVINAKISCVIS